MDNVLLTFIFLVTNVETIPNTVTEGTWELIQRWVDICNTCHPYCCIDSQYQYQGQPSRLLEIDSTASLSKIKLVEGEEIPQKARYMTLSHCWGTVRPLVLSKATWKQFRDSVPVSELPRTFQDAVTITERLHVKYLWIDSLCILQDSEEDWAKESNQMASIYGGSYSNIAASGASDCNGGCLGPRPQTGQHRAVRIVANSPRTEGHVEASDDAPMKIEYPSDFICFSAGPEWTEFDRSSLSRRAWVFQERVLSPRTLHFGLSQLFWECNQHLACERFPDSLTACGSLKLSSYKRLHQHEFYPGLETFEETAAWSDFLSQYSASGLTYDTDRLVAMAGIVDEFAVRLQDDFLGGLWRKRLVSQLLWARADTQTYGRRSREYVAPSWSWASLFDTRIQYLKEAYWLEKVLQILHAEVREKSNGPKYALCDGAIRARCCIIRISVHEECGNAPTMIVYSSTNRSIQVPSWGVNLTFDTEDWRQFELLWIVPVTYRPYSLTGRQRKFTELILNQAGTGSESYFMRCGVFSISGDHQEEWMLSLWTVLQEFRQARESAESTEINQDDNLSSTYGGNFALATASYVSVITIK